jgi:RNA recognition motif-containing protein
MTKQAVNRLLFFITIQDPSGGKRSHMIRIYVGNMPHVITEEEIKRVFEGFGTVLSIDLIKDKATGKSWGYGFVIMDNKQAGLAAIETMNNHEYWGKPLRVERCRQNPSRRRRSNPSYRY